ncbi:hypothetical protein GGI07_005316 [Coemansia sp. Benny D115]|nr:hypothetical protein GGI07_005316 [Coemansia sp. Benny D115]
MKLKSVLALLIAGLSTVSAYLEKRQDAQITKIAPDANNTASDVRYLSYAMLVPQGDVQRSTCEVIILTETTGLVAANCVDWDATNNVNPASYQIAAFGSNNGPLGLFAITQIKMHPNYNKDTFENNLAVVRFDAIVSAGTTLTARIADNEPDWSNKYLIYHSLASVNPLVGNQFQAIGHLVTNTPECSNASPLFSANKEDYVCSFPSVNSNINPGCVTGYTSIAGVTNNGIAIGALYSYSVGSASGGLCSDTDNVLNYYTLLRNYVPWFTSELSITYESIHGTAMENQYTAPNTDANYKMVTSSNAGANFVARNGLEKQSAAPVNNSPGTTNNQPANDSQNAQPRVEANTSVNVITSVVQSVDVAIVTSVDMRTSQVMATATETISTTTTTTSTEQTTSTTTSTTVTTSTSTDVITSTVTVTSVINEAAGGAQGTGMGNNIGININGGSEKTVTVTSVSTTTVTEVSPIVSVSVMTVTASVILSASVVEGQTQAVGAPITTVVPAAAETMTVTATTTSLITSIYTVTAIPSVNDNDGSTATQTVTVTQTVPSVVVVTVEPGKSYNGDISSLYSMPTASAMGVGLDSIDEPETEKKSKLSAGAIGAIVGALLLLALLAYFFLYRKNKKGENGVSRARNWLFSGQRQSYGGQSDYRNSYGGQGDYRNSYSGQGNYRGSYAGRSMYRGSVMSSVSRNNDDYFSNNRLGESHRYDNASRANSFIGKGKAYDANPPDYATQVN